MTFRHEFDRLGRRPFATLTDRQSNRHPRSLADPAADIDLTIMQLHQAFDDRQPEPRTIMFAVMARTRLEEGLSQTRKIVLFDSDTRVLNRHKQI